MAGPAAVSAAHHPGARPAADERPRLRTGAII